MFRGCWNLFFLFLSRRNSFELIDVERLFFLLARKSFLCCVRFGTSFTFYRKIKKSVTKEVSKIVCGSSMKVNIEKMLTTDFYCVDDKSVNRSWKQKICTAVDCWFTNVLKWKWKKVWPWHFQVWEKRENFAQVRNGFDATGQVDFACRRCLHDAFPGECKLRSLSQSLRRVKTLISSVMNILL